MNRKYELLKDDSIAHAGQTLYRIRALKDFGLSNSVQNFPDLGWKQRPKVSTLAM